MEIKFCQKNLTLFGAFESSKKSTGKINKNMAGAVIYSSFQSPYNKCTLKTKAHSQSPLLIIFYLISLQVF